MTAERGSGAEIACDESGYEGEKLIGTTTDVFAHASVDLETDVAAACMRQLRRRIGSPATEYKANHLLRARHRAVLTWLLGPNSPVGGHAHVFLIEKHYYVIAKLVELVLGPDQSARADALYREGPRAFGPQRWRAFLLASNDLLRDRVGAREAFGRVLGALRRVDAAVEPIDGVLDLIGTARLSPDPVAQAGSDPAAFTVDPLVPAIIRAVAHWGGGSRPVTVVHDRQNMLTPQRIARLATIINDDSSAALASLILADSGSDPRIQVADIMAGTARKIASDELNGGGDATLTALVRPYLDALSVWGDEHSWSRLRPPTLPATRNGQPATVPRLPGRPGPVLPVADG